MGKRGAKISKNKGKTARDWPSSFDFLIFSWFLSLKSVPSPSKNVSADAITHQSKISPSEISSERSTFPFIPFIRD